MTAADHDRAVVTVRRRDASWPQRLARVGAMALVLAWLAVVAAVLPAAAHAELESSEPEVDGSVEAPLDVVQVTFADALLPDGDHGIQLVGPDGEEVASGGDEVEPGVVELELLDGLTAAGEHTVRWVVVADDSDEQRGEFTFTATDAALGPAGDATDDASEPEDEATGAADDTTDAADGAGEQPEDVAATEDAEERAAREASEDEADAEALAAAQAEAAGSEDGGTSPLLVTGIVVALGAGAGTAVWAMRREEA